MPKKSVSNLINLSAVDMDPAVEATLARGDRRQAESQLPKADRARLTKDRAKTAARHRFNMDLDPQLDTRLAALASEWSCPASGLANLAIALFLDAYDGDAIDLRAYTAPSKSPRYDRTVKLPAQKLDKSPPRGSP
jgi:hypothetical protein